MLEVMPVLLGWRFHSSICWHTSPAYSLASAVLMLLVFLYPTSLSLLNSELICRSYGSFGFLAVVPRAGAVVPLDLTVLPLGVAVLLLASGTKKLHPGLPPQDLGRLFRSKRYYRCRSRGSTTLER